MNLNPTCEEYTAELGKGIIEINKIPCVYDSMIITSKLLQEGYLKEHEIVLELERIIFPPKVIDIMEKQTKEQTPVEIQFKIQDNTFKHDAVLESACFIQKIFMQECDWGHVNVKFSIGLAGSHINKGLHKLVEEMQRQMKGDTDE